MKTIYTFACAVDAMGNTISPEDFNHVQWTNESFTGWRQRAVAISARAWAAHPIMMRRRPYVVRDTKLRHGRIGMRLINAPKWDEALAIAAKHADLRGSNGVLIFAEREEWPKIFKAVKRLHPHAVRLAVLHYPFRTGTGPGLDIAALLGRQPPVHLKATSAGGSRMPLRRLAVYNLPLEKEKS